MDDRDTLFDRTEARHLRMPGIDAQPVVRGVEDDIRVEGTGLSQRLREIRVETDRVAQPAVRRTDTGQSAIRRDAHGRFIPGAFDPRGSIRGGLGTERGDRQGQLL